VAYRLPQLKKLNSHCDDKTKSDVIAAELKTFIANGHYVPGEKLPSERALAESLAISRVSIRSALQLLKAQGLVVSKPGGGGTFVASPVEGASNPLYELVTNCSENLNDLFLVNTHLDAWGIRRAAERITEEQVMQLRELVRDYQTVCGDSKKLSMLDKKIHMEIAQITKSAIYINLTLLTRDVLNQVLETHRIQIFDDLVHAAQIGRRNCLLIEALAEHDPDKAEKIMRERRLYFGRALEMIPATTHDHDIL
jgi:DNA-binding FadR family transcriptional regulator